METARFVEGLREDLAAAAAMGDQAIVEAAERLSRAVEASVRLHLLDVLQEAAAPAADDDASARVTLRLSERLKSQAEAAAGREGVSLNTWIVRSVSAAVGRRTVGNRLRGFAAG